MLSLLLIAFHISIAGALAERQIDVVFSKPGFAGGRSAVIEEQIVAQIEAAVPGSKIYGANYNFNSMPVAQALVAAQARGVDVNLIFDGGNKGRDPSTPFGLLQAKLDKKLHRCKSFISVTKRGGSCHGLAMMHNKFFLFSELKDGSKFVVSQTSTNFLESQSYLFNELITFKGDQPLFQAFQSYWEGMLSDKTKFFTAPLYESADVTLHAFPLKKGDPVLEVLNKISCQIPGSKIRVVQSVFTRAKLAARLKQLSEQGCDVKVLGRIDRLQRSPSKKVVKKLGTLLTLLPFRSKKPKEQAINSFHVKLILIDASINQSEAKDALLITGSHNLDFFSLRGNDEIMLQIRNRPLLEKYFEEWEKLQSEGLKELGSL